MMNRLFLLLSAVLLIITACSKDIEKQTQNTPTISFTDDQLMYDTKVGQEITITPNYEFVESATYKWSYKGEVISQEPTLKFIANKQGDHYIQIEVTTNAGSTSGEIVISALNLAPPTINMIAPSGGYNIAKDSSLIIIPEILNSGNATFLWEVNGEQVGDSQELKHPFTELGTYTLTLTATNEDGADTVTTSVNVLPQDELSLSWSVDKNIYNCSLGREVLLEIFDIINYFGGDFIWEVNGIEAQRGSSYQHIFKAESIGKYQITLSLDNGKTSTILEEFTVNVSASEGTYRRNITANSSSSISMVYEFTPAPGQFVNDSYSCQTPEEACEYAKSQLTNGEILSLGAFGGCVVVGFDHSIENDGGYNIGVQGNQFQGSSEPAIVMIMQDENGDGLPNDTWYELAGSETESNNIIRNYSITYTKPSAARTAIQWQDNQHRVGFIEYSDFHLQSYYYPMWVAGESITFRGTCLKPKIDGTNTDNWVVGEYDWGYADNYSKVDNLNTDNYNYFKISNAIDHSGKHIDLKYIDFIKIYTAVNTKAGWLGEVSSDISNVIDYNLGK